METPNSRWRRNKFESLKNKNLFIPYRFSSYIDPRSDFKKLNDTEKIYDLVYIGCKYEWDMIKKIMTLTKYNSFIHISGGGSNAITGDEFEDIYRKSKICLGFMAEENNMKNTVTERIWEAFSFGCLVITNSKCASEITNNTAIYYDNIEDGINKIDYYVENEEERKKKINEGYDIFTSYGNYKHNAKEFIDHCKK